MPCYNELHHTKKGVQSILDNSPPVNFVFIDNGSTDGTLPYLQTISPHIIRNPTNLYVNPAWNQGLKYVLSHSLGEYICIINNDIEVGKNWLEPIFWLFEHHKNEFYVPMSNTQENPAFGDFHKYVEDAWNRPLELRYILQPFVGFCMFIRKEHIGLFYPIPEQMKVLRGDDWITDCLASNGILPRRVSRCAVNHFGGATQRGMPIHDLRNQDYAEFDKLYRTEYKRRGIDRIHEVGIKLL